MHKQIFLAVLTKKNPLFLSRVLFQQNAEVATPFLYKVKEKKSYNFFLFKILKKNQKWGDHKKESHSGEVAAFLNHQDEANGKKKQFLFFIFYLSMFMQMS